jgi:hypothetical protein
MTRKTTKSNEIPTIVLKIIHDDIMNANANATLTCKQMRAKLRVIMNDIHVRNSSWIFTQSQYDVVRAMFDATYRAKIERANKRNTKSNATPRKRNAKSNDVVANVETNVETIDAND